MNVKLTHHSLSDWNFPAGSWELYALRFISPLRCVRAYTDRTSGFTWIFLKDTLAPCITNGRIISHIWHRSGSSLFPKWCFRTQALPPGEGVIENNPDNCYQVIIDSGSVGHTRITIKRIAGQTPTQLYQDTNVAWPDAYRIWSKWRITWFSYIASNFTSVLRIIVDGWNGYGWQECVQIDDSVNLWEDSGTNLVGICGFGWNVSDDFKDCIDDTEVWEET